MFDSWFYNNNAWGFVLTNLILHILTCLAGFFWLKKVSFSFANDLSLSTALIIIIFFLWYPFHSEAVFWITGRTASLSLLFFLLAWSCILYHAKNKLLLWFSLPFIVLGYFSYENCSLFPLSLSIWWLLLEKKSEYKKRRILLVIVFSWFLLAAYMFTRRLIAKQWVGSYLSDNLVHFSIQAYLKNTFALLGRSFLPPMDNKAAIVVITIVIIAILTVVTIKLYQQKKINRLWILFLFHWLMSYAYFVSLGIDSNGYESERYLYFPSFFLCAWLIYSTVLLSIKPIIKKTFLLFLIFYFIYFFSNALKAYRKAGKLAKDTIDLVEKNSLIKKVDIYNLPYKSYGIPTLRFSFNNYIKWINPNIDTSNIQIISATVFKWNKNVVLIDSTTGGVSSVIRFEENSDKNNPLK